jgi:hypothetical protein
MSNPAHISLLERGVAAFNTFRGGHPDVVPDLSGSNIRVKKLVGIDLRGANLKESLLPGADLRDADLSGADLTRADLMEANLQGATLTGANLERANLMGSNLAGANLEGANLEGAILFRADLQGSECVYHHLWFNLLMDFADSLIEAEDSPSLMEFEDIENSLIESSYVSTRTSRLEITLSDPVSTRAAYEILGALNRLYQEAASEELLGPIIQIGTSGGEEDEKR